ncbi:MAG: cytochrome b6-f complex subunit 6 [Cyanobacteria bacterium]|nr:cytochrome b6-f complex subunit 6 [Cyanobacteriota bacterium]
MGPVIYLLLVAGGLTAAAAIAFVLRGVKLI